MEPEGGSDSDEDFAIIPTQLEPASTQSQRAVAEAEAPTRDGDDGDREDDGVGANNEDKRQFVPLDPPPPRVVDAVAAIRARWAARARDDDAPSSDLPTPPRDDDAAARDDAPEAARGDDDDDDDAERFDGTFEVEWTSRQLLRYLRENAIDPTSRDRDDAPPGVVDALAEFRNVHYLDQARCAREYGNRHPRGGGGGGETRWWKMSAAIEDPIAPPPPTRERPTEPKPKPKSNLLGGRDAAGLTEEEKNLVAGYGVAMGVATKTALGDLYFSNDDDTPVMIAAKFGLDADALVKMNKKHLRLLDLDSRLKPMTRLWLTEDPRTPPPKKQKKEAPAAAAATAAAAAPAPAPVGAPQHTKSVPGLGWRMHSEEQRAIMQEFWKTKGAYPSQEQKDDMAERSGLKNNQVHNWFHNQRMAYAKKGWDIPREGGEGEAKPSKRRVKTAKMKTKTKEEIEGLFGESDSDDDGDAATNAFWAKFDSERGNKATTAQSGRPTEGAQGDARGQGGAGRVPERARAPSPPPRAAMPKPKPAPAVRAPAAIEISSDDDDEVSITAEHRAAAKVNKRTQEAGFAAGPWATDALQDLLAEEGYPRTKADHNILIKVVWGRINAKKDVYDKKKSLIDAKNDPILWRIFGEKPLRATTMPIPMVVSKVISAHVRKKNEPLPAACEPGWRKDIEGGDSGGFKIPKAAAGLKDLRDDFGDIGNGDGDGSDDDDHRRRRGGAAGSKSAMALIREKQKQRRLREKEAAAAAKPNAGWDSGADSDGERGSPPPHEQRRYAAVTRHNVELVYLTRVAAASLLHLDEDTFDEVTVMSYVRFKCKQLANGEAHYRLVQVNRIEHGDEYEVNPGTPDTTKTTRWLVCNNMGTEKTLALADIRCVLYTGPHTTALAW